MNILYVYKDYYPVLGGIENNLRHLAEAFARRGHQVTVLVTHPGRRTVEEDLNGVHVIRAGRLATVASTPLSLNLPRQLHALQPDLTHLHLPYPVGEVSQLLAGHAPFVVTYHADVTRPIQRAIMWVYAPILSQVLRRAARVLVTSPNYAASSPYLRAVVDRIAIVTSSVDVQRFAPAEVSLSPAQGEARRDGAPLRLHEAPTILFVGLLRHYKGVDHLIHALAQLPDPARLLIAGTGPKRAEWEALSHALQLRERVQFLGHIPDADLPALYQIADIFVLPAVTRAEALGLVLVEAMASGLPCITTEIGSGTSYLVQHGVTGLVVPPRSPTALAEALHTLIANPALRAWMGQAGRERVLEHFTLERMIERVDQVYRDVLEAR